MDHQQILALIKQADHQMLDLSDTVANLQKHITALIEENNQLKMANLQLHDSLLSYQEGEPSKVVDSQNIPPDIESPSPNTHPSARPGQARLEEYYHDGIHICHQFFGAHRSPDEACILCLGVLDEMSQH